MIGFNKLKYSGTIIDTHTFIGEYSEWDIKSAISQFKKKEFSNFKFLTIAFNAKYNEEIISIVDNDNNFLGRYLIFNPNKNHKNYSQNDSVQEIKLLAKNKHVIGLKTLPPINNLPINSALYEKYFKIAIENNIPILVHCSSSRTDFTSTEMFDQICTKFPKLKLILAHFGGINPEYMKKTVVLAVKHENIFLNTTCIDPNRTKKQINKETGVRIEKEIPYLREEILEIFLDAVNKIPNKIIFGSDLGYYSADKYDLWPITELSAELQKQIFYDNVLALFNRINKIV